MHLLDQIYSILYFQLETAAIHKAVNNVEGPVKQKHVRSTIINTFQAGGAQSFWSVVARLPTTQNKIVAWKLCYVIHKVLREGHSLCLVHSQKHVKDVDEIGKFWGNSKEDYGKLIKFYCQLLTAKLEFHKKNLNFSGCLEISQESFEAIGDTDVNIMFQIVVEMMDYMDRILELQSGIFGCLDLSRSNSTTSSGQCKLSPLTLCVQEASKLYNYCIKLLFKLHTKLPTDMLVGHKNRFLNQFQGLRKLFKNTENLEYFKTFLSVPHLSNEPPNFSENISCQTICSKEMPCSKDTIFVPDLTSEDIGSGSSSSSSNSQNNLNLVLERESLLRQLQTHSDTLKSEFSDLVDQHKNEIDSLKNKIKTLETEIALKNQDLTEKQNQMLERNITEETQIEQNIELEKQLEASNHQLDDSKNQLEDSRNNLKTLENQLDCLKKQVENSSNHEEALDQHIKDVNEQVEDLKRQLEDSKNKIIKMEESQETTEKNNLELHATVENFQKQIMELENQITELEKQIKELQNQLHSLQQQNANQESINQELTNQKLSNQKLANQENEYFKRQLIQSSVEENKKIIRTAIDDLDKRSKTYFSCEPKAIKKIINECLESLNFPFGKNPGQFVATINKIAHHHALCLHYLQSASDINADVVITGQIIDGSKELGADVLNFLEKSPYFLLDDCNTVNHIVDHKLLPDIEKIKQQLNVLSSLTNQMEDSMRKGLSDMLDQEILQADRAIQEADIKIQDLVDKSKACSPEVTSGLNEKILESCKKLMESIKLLIHQSKFLQAEIVSQGKASARVKDFYKRSHQWTDGFVSAAKAVAGAAIFFVFAADKVVTGQGKLEELVVAAQEVAATTAQLVVAGRVKADCNSQNLLELTKVSKDVLAATGGIIAAVKTCSEKTEVSENFNTSSMTLHEAKMLEIEAQVRILELEKELQQERQKFSALRRHHYQLEGEDDGLIEDENLKLE